MATATPRVREGEGGVAEPRDAQTIEIGGEANATGGIAISRGASRYLHAILAGVLPHDSVELVGRFAGGHRLEDADHHLAEVVQCLSCPHLASQPLVPPSSYERLGDSKVPVHDM